jgi:hypothetical protein
MTETAPFPAFRPATPKDAKPPITLVTSATDPMKMPAIKPKRKQTTKSKTEAQPVAEKPKRKYRKRDPKAARKPRSVKVELSTALDILAGVKEKDKALLLHMVETMQQTNKAGRKRVLHTLIRVFNG